MFTKCFIQLFAISLLSREIRDTALKIVEKKLNFEKMMHRRTCRAVHCCTFRTVNRDAYAIILEEEELKSSFNMTDDYCELIYAIKLHVNRPCVL